MTLPERTKRRAEESQRRIALAANTASYAKFNEREARRQANEEQAKKGTASCSNPK